MDKICPIFTAMGFQRRVCRGEECQLWWFCRGPDEEEEEEWVPGCTGIRPSPQDPPYPHAIVECKRNENGDLELDADKMFPQSAKEEPPLARLVLTGDAKEIAEIAEAVKRICGDGLIRALTLGDDLRCR